MLLRHGSVLYVLSRPLAIFSKPRCFFESGCFLLVVCVNVLIASSEASRSLFSSRKSLAHKTSNSRSDFGLAGDFQ